MTHPIVNIRIKNKQKILEVYKDSTLKVFRCISCFGDGNAFTGCDFDSSCGYCEGIGEFSFDEATEV